jgi:hypothetical protein
MTTMNGAKHDVEDILASIRTSIADRSPFENNRREAHVTTLRGRSGIADEAMEFELPQIFKAAPQQINERPNLLGRLSEALSSSGQPDWDRDRSRVIPFEPVHGRMLEPPPVALEVARENPAAAAKAAEKVTAENNGVKREMATFFDTRMNRMCETARVPEPAPAPAPVVESKPAPKSAPKLAPYEPPRLPEITSAEAQNGAVEDAAAQLLRPILKQWLTENMPKIVEKALRSESNDDEQGGSSRG